MLILAFPVESADWKVVPRVSLRQTYSDNVTLSPSGQQSDDFITEVNPGVSLSAAGGGLKLQFDYTMQNLFYVHDSSRNDVFHQLRGNGTAELVEDRLFVDASASAGQQPTSITGKLATDNTSITNNRSNFFTFSVSPYVRQRIGGEALAELRYRLNQVSYDGATVSDALTNEVSASLRSAPGSRHFSWSLTHTSTAVDNATGADTDTHITRGDVRLTISPKFHLLGGLGYEKSNFVTSGVAPNGPTWSVGLGWTPTSRLSLDVTYNKRFFGQTWAYTLTQRTAHTTWTSGYSEDINTTQSQAVNPVTFNLLDPATQLPLLGPNGQPIQLSVGIPVQVNETFLTKRMHHSVVWTTAKSVITGTAFYSDRIGQASGTGETQKGANASWVWRFGPHTSSNVGLSLSRQAASAGTTSDLFNLTAGLTHQFGRSVSGTLSYRHVEQESTQATDSYNENALVAGVGISF